VCFTEANKHCWSIVCFWRNNPRWTRASSITRFLDHTQRRITVGRLLRTSDQLVAGTSTWQHMPPVGFKPTISAGERSQTYALDRVANGTCTRDHKLLCCLHSLLNEKLNYSYRFVKIELWILSQPSSQPPTPPENYPQAKNGWCKRSRASPAFLSDNVWVCV
jgi:hypothetical protein